MNLPRSWKRKLRGFRSALAASPLADLLTMRSRARCAHDCQAMLAAAGTKLPTPDDPRPTVLVHLPFLAVGGAETLTLEILRRNTNRFRFVVFTTEPLEAGMGSMTAAFEEVVTVISLEEIGPERMHTDLVIHLARRLHARSLFVANGSSWFYRHLDRVRRELPDLWIVNQVYDHCIGWIECYDARLRRKVQRHIAPNRAILDAYRNQFGITGEQACLVHHGIDIDEFDPARFPPERVAGLKAKLGLPGARRIVASLARLHPQKRPLDFLELARRFQGDDRFHFLLAGDGPMAAQVEQYLKLYPLENVSRLPFVKPFHEVIAAIDLLCVTSEYEGLPLVVLNALAMNKPVLATDVGCLAEVLAGGVGQVVPVGDLDAMAVALQEQAASPASTAGRELTLAKFAINRVAAQYAELMLPASAKIEAAAA